VLNYSAKIFEKPHENDYFRLREFDGNETIKFNASRMLENAGDVTVGPGKSANSAAMKNMIACVCRPGLSRQQHLGEKSLPAVGWP